MKIDVNIRINEDSIISGKSEIASAWIELEDCIKFPVKVRRYIDKQDKQEKMFVSYPQRKSGDGYSNIVYPVDSVVRKEIEYAIKMAIPERLVKTNQLVDVECVSINMLSEKQKYGILRAYASIKIIGVIVNGIMVKEGKNGLFVQMPQHPVAGTYQDTFYATGESVKWCIQQAVLDAYHRELKKQHELSTEKELPEPEQTTAHPEAEAEIEMQTEIQPEVQEKVQPAAQTKVQKEAQPDTPHSVMEQFLGAFRAGDEARMQNVLSHASMEVLPAKFAENYNAVRFQGAVFEAGEHFLELRFYNEYNPLQVIPPTTPISQRIDVVVHENEDIIGLRTLFEKKSESLKNAEKNYQEMLKKWMDITSQKTIEIPRLKSAGPKEKTVAVPKL